MPRDRARLSKVRHHLREALGNLPDGDRDIKHWRPLLTTMVSSVDEMIGPEEEQPTRDLDAELPDGWHGHHKLDGEPSEKELAHVAEPRDHEAERRAAVARIAGEDDDRGEG